MSTKVVKCYHDHCPQCPAVDRWLPDVCTHEGVDLESLNVIQNPAFASRMQVSTVPTVIILRDGKNPNLLYGPRLTPASVRAAIKGDA